MKKIVIAIDGPAGAGKSTIGKQLAKRLDVPYFSTGALYRALAVKCINLNVDATLPQTAQMIADSTNLEIKYHGQTQSVFLDGKDVSNDIYRDEVSEVASKISVHPVIRQKLVDIQRHLADTQSIIMDGRDIGSVVLPKADFKFYLDADVKIRAERRHKELLEKGQNVSYDVVLDEMIERDKRDKGRETSPLIVCEDAYVVDCSNLNIEQVVDKFIEIIKEKKQWFFG